MPLEMIKTLIITANLERTGKITEKEGNIRSADAVEKVHPSGIQKILGK